MPKTINIFMVGVGGQGTILASKILAGVAQEAGWDVKVSEIHGMAQRGGSVVTQVRMGEKIYSPLIPEGEADIILAFEKLEALRWISMLKPGGSIIINDQVIEPVPVLMGIQKYPSDIIENIKTKIKDTVVLDALNIALNCGNEKASNVVLMGVLAKKMELDKSFWEKALEEKVPAKFLELNKAAFNAGYQAAS